MIRVHYDSGYSQCQGSFLEKAMEEFSGLADLDIYVDPKMENDKICWFGDTDQKNGQHGINPSKCLYAQPGWGHELEVRYGKENCLFVPYGVDPDYFQPYPEMEKIYDVGIVGRVDGPYEARAKYLNALRGKYKVYHAGLPIEEIPMALAQCKILFNCIDLEQVNIRFFEELSMGCQVVNHMPSLPVFGDDGTHFVTYKNEKQLMDVVENLLNKEHLREKIARNARKLIKERHTFRHRAVSILKFLGVDVA